MLTPYHTDNFGDIYNGHVLEVLRRLPDASVQCCVTSPPYWSLRDYGTPPLVWGGSPDCEHMWGREDSTCFCGAWLGSLGLEPTPDLYIEHLTEIFSEVKRVLRDDGTLWLNLGDSFYGGKGRSSCRYSSTHFDRKTLNKKHHSFFKEYGDIRPSDRPHAILKPKDLVGIPWRVAFALQADGWYLRQDIIWSKNAMPESVKDRPTRAHEYIFLLAKSRKYYYDKDAIAEPSKHPNDLNRGNKRKRKPTAVISGIRKGGVYPTRNKRSVWQVSTAKFKDAHFAVFPEKLITPCILAGSREGDTVLDPFFGAGTTGVVCGRYARKYLGIELSTEYCKMAIARIRDKCTTLWSNL